MAKKTAAIVGSGNIGTDLMFKIMRRSRNIEVRYMIGIDPESDGLARASRLGVTVSAEGVDWLLAHEDKPDFVFECTSARAHTANAPRYAQAGIRAIDLTPAAVGPYLAPVVNLDGLEDVMNVNMITCAGQATTPIVAAVSSLVPVEYAEIVASIASKSAGPGTRANVDEFTETTAKALEIVGGARRGKAIIIINPVEPPMIMRNTIYCMIPADAAASGEMRSRIRAAIDDAAEKIREYVPGYALRVEPQFDEARDDWNGYGRVGVWVQVAGAADYLPEYAGNLDIITAAATRTADLMAERMDAAAETASTRR
ncbi:MAG: acetaldehyde dehydrogenase (acetylating) [Arthrobacter sp.]